MKRTLLIAVFALGTSVAFAQTDDATLLPSSELPLQGACSDNGLSSDVRGSSAGVSTVSCIGTGSEMMNLNFSDGTYDRCVYIDNADPKNKAYFVPVKTAEEWVAFKKATLAGGKLFNEVRLTYGCEATTVTDACDRPLALPRARNGGEFNVKSQGTKTMRYTCAATTACGVWSMVSSTGSCAVDGMCGSANGVASATPPSSNLCSTGTASTVTEGSAWQWECNGIAGGSNASCSAPIPRNGECGSSNGGSFSSPPTTGLCETGISTNVTQGSDMYEWGCRGEHGGEGMMCSATRVIVGGCGSANGGTFNSPPTTDLCSSSYSASAVISYASTYEWSCSRGAVRGSQIEAPVLCSANRATPAPSNYHWHIDSSECYYGPPAMPQSCPGAEGDVCSSIGATCTAFPGSGNGCVGGTPSIDKMTCY